MAQQSDQPLIEVRDLERTFDVRRRVEGRRRRVREQVRAVHDLTFSVQRGEMVGYIGPNGAGKSTTIKMLTGILVPTGGELARGGPGPAAATGSSWPGASGWSSASAPRCGGTCR